MNKNWTYKNFEINKERFSKLFGIIPYSCYLIYITLINKSIEENIKLYETNKNQLDNYKIDMIKRINLLYNFCKKNNIILYYFNPNDKKFFIRDGINFIEKELNLFEESSKVSGIKNLDVTFTARKRTMKLNENEKIIEKYNKKFLEKLLVKNEYISMDDEYKFYISVVYDFIKNNYIFGKINSFIFLNNNYEDTISYENDKGVIILGLCKNKEKSFSIRSVIYDNYIINYENNAERKFIDTFEVDVDIYDLLVWIDFKDFTNKGKIYKSDYF